MSLVTFMSLSGAIAEEKGLLPGLAGLFRLEKVFLQSERVNAAGKRVVGGASASLARAGGLCWSWKAFWA